MELAINNILDTANVGETAFTDSDDYEKKIESMAEDLVARMTRLHKRCGALGLSSLSQKERAKIQAWADKENDELLRLKETISRRKQSYVKTIPTIIWFAWVITTRYGRPTTMYTWTRSSERFSPEKGNRHISGVPSNPTCSPH